MATLKSNLIVMLTDRVSGAARGVTTSIQRLRSAGAQLEAQNRRMMAPVMGGVGRLMALAGAYVGATTAITGTVGAAMAFEDAMSDVKKVIDFKSPAHFQKMRQDIIDLSKEIPRTAEGLGAIYAAAGQSGIATEDLKKFARMAAQVAVAWDVSDQEAGKALAELKTALGRSVAGVGSLADAINHLGNNSAAGASDILNFTQRIAAAAEGAGFSAEQAAAFGAAMIGSGFQADVASTSFLNMAKALTAGEAATKSQRGAFAQLGLDATKTAKRMQKDAVGTTLDVIERIGKLPEYRQGAVSRLLFGDEARALPTLIRDTKELRRNVGMVADETKYVGSAQKEYDAVAERTSNRIALMWNNIKAWSRAIGTDWLPLVSSAADKVSETFATLSERVTIFDEFDQRIKGFLRGLGFEDGASIVSAYNATWDAIFGRVEDGIKDSDALAAAFEKWRQAGFSIRAFGASIRENIADFERFFGLQPGAIGEFVKGAASWVVPLVAASAGIAVFAGAVRTLTGALLALTGLKMAWGVLKWGTALAGLGGGVAAGAGGAAAAGAAAGAGGAAAGGAAAAGVALSAKQWMSVLGVTAAMGGLGWLADALGDTPGDTFDEKRAWQKKQGDANRATWAKIKESLGELFAAPIGDARANNPAWLNELFGMSSKGGGVRIGGALRVEPERAVQPIVRTLQENSASTKTAVGDGARATVSSLDRIYEVLQAGIGTPRGNNPQWLNETFGVGPAGGYADVSAANFSPASQGPSPTSPAGGARAAAGGFYGGDMASQIRRVAAAIGADPEEVGTLMSFEMGGKWNPNVVGGHKGRYQGPIQFGPPERKQYGYKRFDTLENQMTAVIRYFKDRGYKPGMSGAQLYATVNTGSPHTGNRSDAGNGGTWGSANDKWNHQMGGHRRRARALLASRDASVAPIPRPRPARDGDGAGKASAAAAPSIQDNRQIHVHPAPGMDEEKLASLVHRKMSDDLNARSREAFSDGSY